MKLLPTILLFSITANAQIKPADIILQFISGSADGINQSILHHHWGQGKPFWDMDNSWTRKYKDWPTDKRERYPGSKSILAFTTDGFHLTRFIDRSAMMINIVITDYKAGWKPLLKKALILTFINRIAFSLFYNVIFKQ